MCKLFLTGATGFIGSHFVKHALAQGFEVRAVTRNLNSVVGQDSLEWCEGDLGSQQDWVGKLESIDVVVHTAAVLSDRNAMQAVNFDGSIRLLNAAIEAGVRRWVQLSSVGVYGPVQDGIVDEHWSDNPVGLYEKTKRDFDLALIEASKHSELEVCILRPSTVYGPGMRNQSIQQMLFIMRKNLFAFVGPEGASANYVNVQDVVSALDLCVKHPKAANQIFIVSAWATMEEMVSGLAEGVGLAVPSRRISLSVATLLAKAIQWLPFSPLTLGRVRAMSACGRYCTKKIENDLGWKLKVPVKAGMREFARDLSQ